MKQDEMKNLEKTEVSLWETPILEEIDVALITQGGIAVPSSDGGGFS